MIENNKEKKKRKTKTKRKFNYNVNEIRKQIVLALFSDMPIPGNGAKNLIQTKCAKNLIH